MRLHSKACSFFFCFEFCYRTVFLVFSRFSLNKELISENTKIFFPSNRAGVKKHITDFVGMFIIYICVCYVTEVSFRIRVGCPERKSLLKGPQA